MSSDNIIQSFINSSEGRAAGRALTELGIEESKVSQVLHHAARAGIENIEADAQKGGLLGDHAGFSFFAAFASGLVKGDGVMGSLEDGVGGVVVGRIAEAITSSVDIDSSLIDGAAAATAPYVVSYLKKHLNL